MRDERLEVSVTFDERRGLRRQRTRAALAGDALSLGGLRRRIEALAARTMST